MLWHPCATSHVNHKSSPEVSSPCPNRSMLVWQYDTELHSRKQVVLRSQLICMNHIVRYKVLTQLLNKHSRTWKCLSICLQGFRSLLKFSEPFMYRKSNTAPLPHPLTVVSYSVSAPAERVWESLIDIAVAVWRHWHFCWDTSVSWEESVKFCGHIKTNVSPTSLQLCSFYFD